MSTFHLFSQYTHDLARTLNGLCQIYPSKYLAFNLNVDKNNIVNLVSQVSDKMDAVVAEATENNIDYGQIRYEAWKELYSWINKSETGPEAPVLGDINFLSNDTQGGIMYSDIYIHVSPEDAKKTIIVQELANASTPKEQAFDHDGDDNIRFIEIDRDKATWNAILVYYNLYQVDPRHEDSLMQPVVMDMPLGIYVLDNEASIFISTQELFGNGTSWTTRICSRFISSSNNLNIGNSSKSAEFNTLSKVLTEFGNIASVMQSIVRERVPGVSDTLNPAGTGMAYNDILSYLNEFRNDRAVNVPYIRDNHWFVNGRDLGQVVNQDLIDKSITVEKLIEALEKLIEEHPEWFKGPKGDTGEKGDQGPEGKQGPKGAQGIQGRPGADGADGKTWIPFVDANGVLSWSLTGQTPPPTANIRGADGKTWRPEVDLEGNLTWTLDSGVTQPSSRNIRGADGKTWVPHVDENGNLTWNENGTPPATMVNIKGPKGDTGPAGPRGEAGPSGGEGTPGAQGPKGDTWKPRVSSDGILSWEIDNSPSDPGEFDFKNLFDGIGGGGCDCGDIEAKIEEILKKYLHTDIQKIVVKPGEREIEVDVETTNWGTGNIMNNVEYTIDNQNPTDITNVSIQ